MSSASKIDTDLLGNQAYAAIKFSSEDPEAEVKGSAQMRPVVIKGLFGWLHSAPENLKNDVAVVICPALNLDALDSHHSLRVLADTFASTGYPTLRFDYPTTGDSCDLNEAEFTADEHWATWQQSIHAVADWLRASTGASQLIFCGLRIGATLATLSAAQRDDVAGLILLAPVLRGRSYIRQLSIEAGLQRGAVTAIDAGLEFEELHLSAATVQLIEQVDLRHVKLPAGQHVAIFAQAASNPLSECGRIWTQQGVEVAFHGFDGLTPMLQHILDGEGEPADFSLVVDWVKQAIPVKPNPSADVLEPGCAMLRLPGCTEVPLIFGPDKRLFGVFCCPEKHTGETAVIIGNTGHRPHYGIARFGTEFARQLASAGIASLRIDFAGIGDSIGPEGKENVLSHMLETDRTGDFSAAIDALEQLGYRSFIAHGLCAGAYHAFHAALADTRIETLLLLNMPVFSWTKGDLIEVSKRKSLPPSHYFSKLTSQKFWRQLLRREVDVLGILGGQFKRLREQIQAIMLSTSRPEIFVQQAMTALSKRHVKTLFLYQHNNYGIEMFEKNFGTRGEEVCRFEGASVQFVPEFDRKHIYDQTLRISGRMMVEFLAKSMPISRA